MTQQEHNQTAFLAIKYFIGSYAVHTFAYNDNGLFDMHSEQQLSQCLPTIFSNCWISIQMNFVSVAFVYLHSNLE